MVPQFLIDRRRPLLPTLKERLGITGAIIARKEEFIGRDLVVIIPTDTVHRGPIKDIRLEGPEDNDYEGSLVLECDWIVTASKLRPDEDPLDLNLPWSSPTHDKVFSAPKRSALPNMEMEDGLIGWHLYIHDGVIYGYYYLIQPDGENVAPV